jgi:hypothetical protein
MSALPPKADMVQHDRDVRFVPKADITFSVSGLGWEEQLRQAKDANTKRARMLKAGHKLFLIGRALFQIPYCILRCRHLCF